MRVISLNGIAFALLATWWLSPQNVQAQASHSAATPMQVWNQTSQGMSSNAALAFYRVQNVGRPSAQPTAWPQYSRTPTVAVYSTNLRVVGNYYPTPTAAQYQKPFASVRPHRTAFDRYWPYLLEGYEDPETGFIVWTLP